MNGDAMAAALWYVSPGRAEIRQEKLGALADGMVRVRASHGAISRGTESLVASGRVPKSEYQRMRAPFMAGEFPFPVKYGYSTVGRVEAGPPNLHGCAVFVLHPHQTLFDVPEAAALALPETLPPRRAVLAANMETALNATWDAEPIPSGSIAVIGAGVVGTLTAFLLAKRPGAEVTLIDVNPARAGLAGPLGLHFATPDRPPRDCALVVHASASAEGLALAIDMAGEEAMILELSWYGEGTIPVPLGGAFHSRRLKLFSSQVGKVAPSRRATTIHRQRLEQAIALLADERLEVLLERPVRFGDLPLRLPEILAARSGLLCPTIDYS